MFFDDGFSQVRLLVQYLNSKECGESEKEGIQELIEIISKFRDEELEHLDIAVESGSREVSKKKNVFGLQSVFLGGGISSTEWCDQRRL